MELPTVSPNVITAIGAASAAIFMKIIEKWIGEKSENAQEAERIREELRKELARYREDNIRLEHELEELRGKYWKQLSDAKHLRELASGETADYEIINEDDDIR